MSVMAGWKQGEAVAGLAQARRAEGDLVAKCYFSKHKLVWEVLEGGLKSKIEIQWSDITALKVTLPEIGDGSLDVMVSLSRRCICLLVLFF